MSLLTLDYRPTTCKALTLLREIAHSPNSRRVAAVTIRCVDLVTLTCDLFVVQVVGKWHLGTVVFS